MKPANGAGPWLLRTLLAIAATFAFAALLPARAEANVSCVETGVSTLAFGGSDTATTTVNYLCTNNNPQPANFILCLGVGDPSFPGTPSQFVMTGGGNQLNYNLYTDAAGGQPWTKTSPITTSISIPGGVNVTVPGAFTYYGRISSGQSPAPGNYMANVFDTILGFLPSGAAECQDTMAPDFQGQRLTLTVTAVRSAACTVAALGPADLGTVLATETDLSGTTSINVVCPTGVPYYIGLEPSNGNSGGAGVLAGTGTNTDAPPYQLRSVSDAGPVWGNTATSTSVGNGVAGTGSGAPQSHQVFVTMPSAAFQADTYTDTVTVNVNY